MRKKEARKIFIEKRDNITINEKTKWDDLILIHFQTIDFPFLDSVFSFYPIEEKNEVNSILLTDYLRFKNPSLQICYPKIDMNTTTMDAIACHADSIFQANEWNIMEPLDVEVVDPKEIDMVILPLLAFDQEGHRIGYGKGYYDRYLKECRDDCIKVGVSYFAPIGRIEDAEAFDVPLNFCITPERAYVF